MALDYNPDKERHVDHGWIVVNAEKGMQSEPITLGDKSFKFGKDGAFTVKDEGLANEIRKTVGKRATVSRYRRPSVSDRGHTYFFGQMPPMPWHKYDAEGRRIKDGE